MLYSSLVACQIPSDWSDIRALVWKVADAIDNFEDMQETITDAIGEKLEGVRETVDEKVNLFLKGGNAHESGSAADGPESDVATREAASAEAASAEITGHGSRHRLGSRSGAGLRAVKRSVGRSFVKFRILISLAQVLDGIGSVFAIPYVISQGRNPGLPSHI